MYKSKKDRLLLRIMLSQYSLVDNGVYVFFLFDVTLFFANSACARGARRHPGAAAHHRGFVSYTYSQCVRCLARVLITILCHAVH